MLETGTHMLNTLVDSDVMNQMVDMGEKMMNDLENSNDMLDEFSNDELEFKKKQHNTNLSTFAGLKRTSMIKFYLNRIISMNQTDIVKVMVIYNDIEAQTDEEISNIYNNLKEGTEYLLSNEQDENGWINKIYIKDV